MKVTSEQREPASLSSQYFSVSENSVTSTISGFLSKPIRIETGTLSATDTTSTFISHLMPYTLLNQKIYKTKLHGYFGIRGTLVFTLQLNGQRFQQGRYMLTWVPLGGAPWGVTGLPGNTWVDSHSATLTQRTQLPRVEVDVNCDTSGEIRIPFSSSLDFYPLSALEIVGSAGNWGVLRIYPYRSLTAVSGSLSCAYTLWGHMEDIELIGPSVPQTIEFQAAGITNSRKGKTPSEKEADSVGVGPVASMAFKVSRAAQYFNPIPMLGNYTSALSWASDIVGNAANVFGWAAPISLAPATRVVRSLMPYSTNVNKVDVSFPLSLDCTNAVEVMPGFGGTNSDELDMVQFCSIPFFNYDFVFSTSNVVGDQLLGWFVSPLDNIKSQLIGGRVVQHYGPLQYMTRKFSYWRGSIKYKLKIVKTEFHSGRISVSFTPMEVKGTVYPITFANSNYALRDIIDIRETNEYEFTVPYICSSPYLMTTDLGSRMGAVQINVIDPLVAPDTVANSIYIAVEMSAGQDIEFAGYRNQPLTPMSNIEYQANAFDSSECSLVAKVIGNANPGTFQLSTSKAAVGERITNLRLLLKRFYPIVRESAPILNHKYIEIVPFAYSYSELSESVQAVRWQSDLLGELSSMYAFSRGGVRIKILSESPTDNLVAVMRFHDTFDQTFTSVVAGNATDYGIPTEMDRQISVGTYVCIDPEEAMIEVQVPQYMYTHSRANAQHGISASVPYVINPSTLTTPFTVAISTIHAFNVDKTNIKGTVLRAAADDFNLSCFVSIPPLG